MKKILHYITYQTFPADTANSLQTISNLKYFVKNNYEVNLYFPLREKNSSKELENIQKKYLRVVGTLRVNEEILVLKNVILPGF